MLCVLRVVIHLKNMVSLVLRVVLGVLRVVTQGQNIKSQDDTPFQIRETCRSSLKSIKLICKLIQKCLKASAKVNHCQNNF